jgi:hypothetical protein
MEVYYKPGIEDISKEYSKSLVWERKIANEFADGHNGQMFTNIDDMCVAKDPAIRYLEIMEIMAMKNDAPYMLHNADVAEKGKDFYKGRLIALSTNLADDDHDLGITDVGAYHRRRDFIINTSFHEPKDPSKANTLQAFECMTFEVKVLNLKTMKHDVGYVMKGLKGWLSLVNLIALRYKTYHEVSLRKNKTIDYKGTLAAFNSTINDEKGDIILDEHKITEELRLREVMINTTNMTTVETTVSKHNENLTTTSTTVLNPSFRQQEKQDQISNALMQPVEVDIDYLRKKEHSGEKLTEFEERMLEAHDDLIHSSSTSEDSDEGTGVNVMLGTPHGLDDEPEDDYKHIPTALEIFKDFFTEGNVNINSIRMPQNVESLAAWQERTGNLVQVREPKFVYTTPDDNDKTEYQDFTRTWELAFRYMFPGMPITKWRYMLRSVMDLSCTSTTILFPRLTNFFTSASMTSHVTWTGGLLATGLSEYLHTRQYEIKEKCAMIQRNYVTLSDFEINNSAATRMQSSGIPSYFLYKLSGEEPDNGWYRHDCRRTEIDSKFARLSHEAGKKLKGNLFLAAAFSIMGFLALISIVILLILLTLKGIGLISPEKYNSMVVMGNAHSSDKILQNNERKHHIKPKNKFVGIPHGLDQGAGALAQIVATATKCVQIDFEDTDRISKGWIFQMGGNCYAMPNHYLALGKPKTVKLTNGLDMEFETKIIPWNQVVSTQYPERDLCFMYLPGIQPSRQVITQHGRSRKEGMPTEASGYCRSDVTELAGIMTWTPLFTKDGIKHFTETSGWTLDMESSNIPTYTMTNWVCIDSIGSDQVTADFPTYQQIQLYPESTLD